MSLSAFISILLATLLLPGLVIALDWDQVPERDIVLFYPGQLSWEMLLTESEHSGADKFREGKDCRQCHEGEERASGTLLVADKYSESTPIKGKPGFLEMRVKTAHDGERLYIHLEFEPGDQPNAGMDEFSTKVAVMIDDGSVVEASRAGCWAACHDNLARMPSAINDETKKYLMRSRASISRRGGDQIKSAAALDEIRSAGGYLEYWQARLRTDGTSPQVIDGHILETRLEHNLPAVEASSSYDNGKWSVVLSRSLHAGGPYKNFESGKIYTLGFSVHAGYTAQRFHYVSLEKTLTLDTGPADFVAARR